MQGPATSDPLLNGHASKLNGHDLNEKGTPTDHAVTPAKGKDPLQEQRRVVYIDEPNAWIKNDGLLRDEGVLFGWNGTNKTEKIAAIKSYYQQLIAPEDVTAKSIEAEIEKIKQSLDIAKSEKSDEQSFSLSASLPGYIVRLLMIVASGVGCFFIVHFYISTIYGTWAAIGVYLFALFAQLTPISYMLGSPTEGLSKSYNFRDGLLEISPPVTATLFISYLAYSTSSDSMFWLFIGLVLLVLLLFCGKLGSGTLEMVTRDIQTWRKRIDSRKAVRRVTDDYEKLKSRLAELTSALKDCNVRIASLEEEKNNKINLFESEYTLAYEFAQKFNKK